MKNAVNQFLVDIFRVILCTHKHVCTQMYVVGKEQHIIHSTVPFLFPLDSIMELILYQDLIVRGRSLFVTAMSISFARMSLFMQPVT